MEISKDLILQRAKAASLARDFDTAIRLYKQLLASDPNNLDLLDKLAQLYIKSSCDTKALPILQQMIKIKPQNTKTLNELGSIYRRLKQYNESIEVLQKALVIDENDPQIYYNLGFTYKFMDRYDDAIECLKTVIDKNPNDVLAYNHLGRIHESKHEYEKALECYKKGLKIDPNHPILHLNMAKTYEALKQNANAITEYETTLRARPGWLEAIDSFSSLLMKSNRTKEAGTLIQQALHLDNKNVKMYSKMGDVYFAQGGYTDAKQEYDNALKIESEYVPALSGLVSSYEKMDMPEEACNTMEVLERVCPNDKDIICKAAHTYLIAGKNDLAQKRIKQIYSTNKNDPKVLDAIGQYYIATRDFQKAQAIKDKLESFSTDYTDHYMSWGSLYEREGKLTAASECFSKACVKSNQKGQAYSEMAKLCEAKGDMSKAMEYYDKAAVFDKDNILYPQYKKSLQTKIDSNVPLKTAKSQDTQDTVNTKEAQSPATHTDGSIAQDIDFLAGDFGSSDGISLLEDDALFAKDFDAPQTPPSIDADDVEKQLSSLKDALPQTSLQKTPDDLGDVSSLDSTDDLALSLEATLSQDDFENLEENSVLQDDIQQNDILQEEQDNILQDDMLQDDLSSIQPPRQDSASDIQEALYKQEPFDMLPQEPEQYSDFLNDSPQNNSTQFQEPQALQPLQTRQPAQQQNNYDIKTRQQEVWPLDTDKDRQKPQDSTKAKTFVELLQHLQDLCERLPQEQKQEYDLSNAKFLLDYSITKLESLSGLLAKALLKRKTLGLEAKTQSDMQDIDAINTMINEIKDITQEAQDESLVIETKDTIKQIQKIMQG